MYGMRAPPAGAFVDRVGAHTRRHGQRRLTTKPTNDRIATYPFDESHPSRMRDKEQAVDGRPGSAARDRGDAGGAAPGRRRNAKTTTASGTRTLCDLVTGSTNAA
jgi:hypothetical protein